MHSVNSTFFSLFCGWRTSADGISTISTRIAKTEPGDHLECEHELRFRQGITKIDRHDHLDSEDEVSFRLLFVLQVLI